MGLKALANGVISFRDVRVPEENLIGARGPGPQDRARDPQHRAPGAAGGRGGRGQGLPGDRAAHWAAERVQWGQPIGKHEAIAHKIADMAATTFAMDVGVRPGQRDGRPGRLRHPPGGGRRQGMEHGPRLEDHRRHDAGPRRPRLRDRAPRSPPAARRPIAGRARDARLPHQPDLRGQQRDHAPVHGPRGRGPAPPGRRRHDRPATRPCGQKLAALPRMAAFYAAWYPTRWLGWGRWPRYAEFGPLAPHLRFVRAQHAASWPARSSTA